MGKLVVGVNDLATWCKQNDRLNLLSEWNENRNGELKPSDLGYGSQKKVWWKCSKGHEWEAVVGSRSGGRGCPFCSGKKSVPNQTDLASVNPFLANEWNHEKNAPLLPSHVSSRSQKKVWWRCSKGHEWQASIYNRSRGTGCPYCSGRSAITGENDLATTYPQIASEWHPTKNGNLKPCDIKSMSSRKVWWLCSKGHDYQAAVNSRTKMNTGCPYCSGRNALKGKNDLATIYPDLSKEWHPDKNGYLKPSDVKPKSGVKVWWKCSQGHEWEAPIVSRVDMKCGCPICSNHQLLKGYNDLTTKYPKIAKEWHPTKNGELSPDDVTYGSERKVWWKCAQGHEWPAVISQRTSRGFGCPYCSGRIVIPGETDLQTENPLIAKEWHPTKNGNLKPCDVKSTSGKRVWWLCEKGHEWQVGINNRVYQKTGCPICSNKRILAGFNDLATTNPELAKEWNYEKNGDLKPTEISFGTDRQVWWKCKYGHEWQSSPNARSNFRLGCPLCSGKGSSLPEQGISYYLESVCKVNRRFKVSGQEVDVFLPEYNVGVEYDGKFYHPTSNRAKEMKKDKKLSDVGVCLIRIKESDSNRIENKTIFFKSDNMHSNYEWAIKQLCDLLANITGNKLFNSVDINVQKDITKIRERIDLYYKENSLATTHPELAKEWNYEKNGILIPEMVYAQSNKRVWWLGKCGHEWQVSPNSRATNGTGCPYCAGQKVLVGFNDLQTLYPDLAKEWNYEKNSGLKNKNKIDISTPDKVSAKSGIKVWWKCEKGHEWQVEITQRASRGDGCPYCSGRRVIKGETDLATLYPDIANEWHPTKNGGLKPTDVKPGYYKNVWWLGKCGHEWQATPSNRTKGSGCPYCAVNRTRSVKNTDTGEMFKSCSEAAKSCGLGHGHAISLCCQGKRKTAGGYHWRFVD